ncbi:MAG: hypothetical protein V1904_05530, partial [Bacteroidota bacterium]
KNHSQSTSSTNGIANTAVGSWSGYENLTGNYNTIMGYSALKNNKAGNGATAIGYNAMLYANNTTTAFTNCNVAVGYQALMGPSGATGNTGNYNTATGYNTLLTNSTGGNNTSNGYNALYSNTTASNNTATGYQSLYTNSTGYCNTANGVRPLFNNTTGKYNIAMGDSVLFTNTSGSYNTASGAGALFSNVTGNSNSAFGLQALYSNTESQNTAFGVGSLYSNISGDKNTAGGFKALYSNVTGPNNTAFGYYALYNNADRENTAVGYYALYSTNTTGAGNTGMGANAMYSNTSGSNNVAMGVHALYNNTTATQNTSVGVNAGQTISTNGNNTCIGYGADVPSTYTNCTFLGYNGGTNYIGGNDEMQLGNSSIQYINAAQPGLTQYSDRRIKNNIIENVPGLAFINLLKPVTYHVDVHLENSITGYPTKTTVIPEVLDSLGNVITPESSVTSIDTAFWDSKYDIEKVAQTGLIAQQVDSAATQIDYDFNGIKKPDNPNQLYGLNYVQFIGPIIKAEQELSKSNDSLKERLKVIDSLITVLQNCCVLGTINRSLNTTGNKDSITAEYLKLSIPDAATLGDAQPNPNSGSTQIPYFIPNDIFEAQIIFIDMLGKEIQKKTLLPGYGLLNIDTKDLPGGVYTFTLFVNGRVIDTKKMVRN